MSSSIHNLEILPPEHALRTFLEKLPEEKSCDPNPDWIEAGNSKRFVLMFRGNNANARARVLDALLRKHQPGVVMVSSHSGPDSSCIIVFLQQAGVSEYQSFLPQNELDVWENEHPGRSNVIPFEGQLQLTAPKSEQPLPPGCKQMVSYD